MTIDYCTYVVVNCNYWDYASAIG